jgi:hypothetical protein
MQLLAQKQCVSNNRFQSIFNPYFIYQNDKRPIRSVCLFRPSEHVPCSAVRTYSVLRFFYTLVSIHPPIAMPYPRLCQRAAASPLARWSSAKLLRKLLCQCPATSPFARWFSAKLLRKLLYQCPATRPKPNLPFHFHPSDL